MKLRNKKRKYPQGTTDLPILRKICDDHPLSEKRIYLIKHARLSAIRGFCHHLTQWFNQHKHLFLIELVAINCRPMTRIIKEEKSKVQLRHRVELTFQNMTDEVTFEFYPPHFNGGECGCFVGLRNQGLCGLIFEQVTRPIELTDQRWGITGGNTLPSERDHPVELDHLIYVNFEQLYEVRVLQPFMAWFNEQLSPAQHIYVYGDPKDPFDVRFFLKSPTKDQVTILPVYKK